MRPPGALSSDCTKDDAYGDRVYWSPDSKRLVGIRTTSGEDYKVYLVESSPKDQVQPKHFTMLYPKPGDMVDLDQPVLFQVEAGKQLRIASWPQ